MRNPTYEDIAFADALAKGVTCRSCEHYRSTHPHYHDLEKQIDESCELNIHSFPRICRRYEYEPGSDEHELPRR